jgi:hypothetical protein
VSARAEESLQCFRGECGPREKACDGVVWMEFDSKSGCGKNAGVGVEDVLVSGVRIIDLDSCLGFQLSSSLFEASWKRRACERKVHLVSCTLA